MREWKLYNIGLWLTLALNVFLFAEYLWDHSNARSVVLFFWIQAIVLGLENIIMMLSAKTHLPMIVNGKPTVTSIGTNIFMSLFFMVHYGIFILAFGGIAVASSNLPGALFSGKWFFPSLFILVAGALIELPTKMMSVRQRNTSLMYLMFIPYLRLLPFAFIVFGSAEETMTAWVFPLFMVGKLIVDLVYYRFFNFTEKANTIRF